MWCIFHAKRPTSWIFLQIANILEDTFSTFLPSTVVYISFVILGKRYYYRLNLEQQCPKSNFVFKFSLWNIALFWNCWLSCPGSPSYLYDYLATKSEKFPVLSAQFEGEITIFWCTLHSFPRQQAHPSTWHTWVSNQKSRQLAHSAGTPLCKQRKYCWAGTPMISNQRKEM